MLTKSFFLNTENMMFKNVRLSG